MTRFLAHFRSFVPIALDFHLGADIRRHKCFLRIIEKGIILSVKVKDSFRSVGIIFNITLRSWFFSNIRHAVLRSILKLSIVLGSVNPASAGLIPPFEDEYVSIIQYCKYDYIRITDKHFRNFFIRCEDLQRYDDMIAAGRLDKARELLTVRPK